MFYVTLTDANGNPLANKTVQIVVLSGTYNVTTDKDGKAGLAISMVTANSYTYAITFLGDDQYKASLGSSVAVITKSLLQSLQQTKCSMQKPNLKLSL